MNQLLSCFIYLPLFTFIVSIFLPGRKETFISNTVIVSITLHLIWTVCFSVNWLLNGHEGMNYKQMVIYTSSSFEFYIDYFFDLTTLVYSMVGGVISLIVAIFSKTYMHREAGYKRFFVTLILFYLGYQIVIFSGNFETLFIGWEIIGLCSFLLISFYRDRYLPVKNSLKTLSVYRLGDVCLILAMWLLHHIFQQNITFQEMFDTSSAILDSNLYVYLSILILVAVAAKSAMLPFSSWLPRAMEGPTTSSAVFYGSLSIHLGVFLLIRTNPLWNHLFAFKIALVILGGLTSMVATSIAKVQHAVKPQIAYASIAQIGLMVIEVALGWHQVALIHFAGNAFLRTYQLLVSPSVLSYKIHNMMIEFKKAPGVQKNTLSPLYKWYNTLYILGVKEWNMDKNLFEFLWLPFKKLGLMFTTILNRTTTVIPIMLSFSLFSFIADDHVHYYIDHSFTLIAGVSALALILTAFTERGSARKAWNRLGIAQVFLTCSIALNEDFDLNHILIFSSGIIISFIVGYVVLSKLQEVDDITLNRFHGHSDRNSGLSIWFLLACMGFIGLPLTPTFLGIDLLFTHIQHHQGLFIFIIALNFIFIELSVLRIYARIFMGPSAKADHAIAFRSS